MNHEIQKMLVPYQIKDIYDQKNAMKEIMQEVVLCGLSRSGFFQKAAFYGGTALRIFHGLDRFSEDLDFSLGSKDPQFDLANYFPRLEAEVRSFGLNVEITEKKKTKESTVQSAFLKANTKEHLLIFYGETSDGGVSKDERIKIKFKVDIDPPAYAGFERKYRLLPVPYEVRLYDLPSLFAGKLHAVLCRNWRDRVKGRDLYDLVFYLSRGIPADQRHLRERLLQTGAISSDKQCSLSEIKEMLDQRFQSIDPEQARSDVMPFIRDHKVLDIWSYDFFHQICDDLRLR